MMIISPRYVNPRWAMGVKALFFDPATRRSCTFGGHCSGRRAKNAGFEIGLRSVALIALGGAVHVPDVALLRVLRRHGDPGPGALRERVLRDGAQVALGDELLEGRRVLAGVGVMLVERV